MHVVSSWIWGFSAKKTPCGIYFVSSFDHTLHGALLPSKNSLFGTWTTGDLHHRVAFGCPTWPGAQQSPHLFNRETPPGRTLSRLRCGVAVVLCCGAQVSCLHLKSSKSHRTQLWLHTASRRAQQEQQGRECWRVSAGPGFGVIKAECFYNCSTVGKLPMSPSCPLTQLPAVQPGAVLVVLYSTTGTAGVPLIHLPLFLQFICVYMGRCWYISEESLGEPGEVVYNVGTAGSLGHCGSLFWRVPQKGRICTFLCARLLSLSIGFELKLLFPPEGSCPFLGHILYFCFPFYAVHPLSLTILQTLQGHPGLWLLLCYAFQNSLCNIWCPVIAWLWTTGTALSSLTSSISPSNI